ncbi:MAG: hypothetical protein LR011_02075 [Verrucomicrobia bacterium]|nr:hypothetical protein [Verrucomicrobiota bacterium]
MSNRTPAWRIASGSGHSSPCLFGNCLILTSFESNRWHVRSYQQATGQVLWDWSVEAREVERGHRNGSPAASSVAIGEDGELVAYSGAFGLSLPISRGGSYFGLCHCQHLSHSMEPGPHRCWLAIVSFFASTRTSILIFSV